MEEKKYNSSKKIQIVKGNHKNLDISDVKDNLTFEVHENSTTEKDIVIPENKNPKDSDN